MKQKLKINHLIFLLSILLIASTSISITYFSYKEFKSTLDDRILQQLLSIKRLKRIQIEAFLEEQLSSKPRSNLSQLIHKKIKSKTFYTDKNNLDYLDALEKMELDTGLFDITPFISNHQTTIICIKSINDSAFYVQKTDPKAIENILFEHTGMGKSGETYIVGSDYRMRTKSRFIPKSNPYATVVKSTSVVKAFTSTKGLEITKDYRNIEVYSAFYNIKISHLNWAIISEMDVKEVQEPLVNLKYKIWGIGLIICSLALILSLFIAQKISSPIKKISVILKSMSHGDFKNNINDETINLEIAEALDALRKLQKSLNTATSFAYEIGQLNLDAQLIKQYDEDTLSEALLNMKKQLILFRQNEFELQLSSKKLLIQTQEKERGRLSKELHDGIGPLLTNLKLSIQSTIKEVEAKENLKELIDQIIKETRLISSSLMPQSLADFGFIQALLSWIKSIENNSKIEIRFSESLNFEAKSLDDDTQICIFRVLQELMNNTIKHGEAKLIVIDISNTDKHIYISYYDDGKGFETTNHQLKGSGIANIKQRVETLKGLISFQKTIPTTRIEFELPLIIKQ